MILKAVMACFPMILKEYCGGSNNNINNNKKYIHPHASRNVNLDLRKKK